MILLTNPMNKKYKYNKFVALKECETMALLIFILLYKDLLFILFK